jgi:hypothetical protein
MPSKEARKAGIPSEDNMALEHEEIAEMIISAEIRVHKKLGPGLIPL